MNEKELATFCRLFRIKSSAKIKILNWFFVHSDKWFNPPTIITEINLQREETYKTLVSFHKSRFLMKRKKDIGIDSTRVQYRLDKKSINEMLKEIITDLEKILMETDPYV